MEDKLLPCPFCGEIPELEKSTFTGISSYLGNSYTVFCSNINCFFNPSVSMGYKSDAIKAWNTRVDKE